MRCSKESFCKGIYFHVYNHTIDGLNLFNSDEDYLLCLKKIKEKLPSYPASIFAYVLMPNHFHFFIRQNSNKPIYRIFNDVFAGYVQIYNRKNNRKGRLFRTPLQHKMIENKNYALQLCQYIHFNPKKAGLVKKLEHWQYSNYLEWIGKRNGTLFCKDILLFNDLTPAMYEDMMKDYDSRKTEKLLGKYLF